MEGVLTEEPHTLIYIRNQELRKNKSCGKSIFLAPRCSVWVASGDQSPGPPEIYRFETCPQAGQAEALKAAHSASDGESWSQVVYIA